MNTIIKRVLAFILSFALIFSTTTSSYAMTSAGGWTLVDSAITGATITFDAIKNSGANAVKATLKHKPTAFKVGQKLLRGGGTAALLIAIPQLLGDAVDWVLDPANNRIIYTPKGGAFANLDNECFRFGGGKDGWRFNKYGNDEKTIFSCINNIGQTAGWYPVPVGTPIGENYLDIATVANKVIANAEAGDTASQDVVKATALDGFAAGELDPALDAKAVPTTDTSNPPDTTNPPVDIPAFDPSSIIAAIQSLAAIMNAHFANLTDAIGLTNAKMDTVIAEQQDTKMVINDGIDRVVEANDRTGAAVGEIVAGVNELGEKVDAQGVVINDAVDRAIGANDANAQATQDVISDSIDKVIDADAVNAQATQDVISQSTDKAIDASNEASKAQLDAIAAQNEWLKEPAPDADSNTAVDVIMPDLTPTNTDFNFGGSCPAPFVFKGSIFGNAISITLLDTAMFCNFLSTYVKYPVYAASSLYALYILGGRKDV